MGRINLQTANSGKLKFELTELKQNTKYFIHMSAGNDLPHFKKDLLKDSKIQRIVFRTKQNLNLFYSEDSKIQPYTASDSSQKEEMITEMNKEWENDPDFGKKKTEP